VDGTPTSFARRYREIPIGFKNPSSRSSPGVTGASLAAPERLEPVPRRIPHVIEPPRDLELAKLPSGDRPDGREALDPLARGKGLGVRVAEGDDHTA
jgi:hypothetical protein